MKISLDWISDFVDLSDLDPATIADRLTLATAEVEEFETIHRAVDGVLIGKVTSVEPIDGATDPEGAKLKRVTVDCGGSRYASVCGAPNVRAGLTSPFAPPGVTLADGQKIEAARVGGEMSQGVLCSARELGMSRWHEVLLECPDSIPAGTPLSEFIPAEDVLIEIDNKSLTHRPDLWGHYAFARELAAVFGRPLREYPVDDLSRYDDLPAYPLSVDDLEACPCYGCLEFRVTAGSPSPLVMQRRLHALGQRTYNLMVDVTNYVMLELAQPTHAFDAERLRAIRVAPMGRKGTFTTLDGQERNMLPDDLLIWSEKEPVALAGIMGGLNSEVEPSTSRVLLESANFKASRVRRTSVRLDLRTESAQRFEKTQPPVNVRVGIARILRLLTDAGATPEATSRLTIVGDPKDRFRPLVLPNGCLKTMAGADITDREASSILESLGFRVGSDDNGALEVGIPPHRSEQDISLPADVVEEVLRVYGYGRIEPKMPSFPLRPLRANKSLRFEHRARRLLASAHRFLEVHNYGWFDDDWLAQIGFEPEGTLALRNPSARPNGLLRTTLIPNLLALVVKNRAHRDRFRLFEIGHVYSLGGGGACLETTRLAGVSYHQAGASGLEEHFRGIKGVLDDLGRTIATEPFAFEPAASTVVPWQAAGGWVVLRQNDQSVGGLGVLDGPILEAVAPEGGQVVWFELEMAQLQGSLYSDLTYVPSPIYPGSWQDFSFVWDLDRGYSQLEERLATFAHPLVTRREFVYAYKGKGLPKGKASYTYRYWIGASDHTLTSDEIEGFRAALLDFLKSEDIPLR